MRNNRKMEEKKMSMSKNIARLAVTAGLTAALSFGGVVAPVTMAFAEGGSTVTFKDSEYATTSTYKGIQIFKATVKTTDGATTVSNIEWASNDVKDAVVAAIQVKDPEYVSDHAQDAADWLNEHSGVADTDSKVASDNVLSAIARNLNGKDAWKTTSAGGASLYDLEAGYWLFLTAVAGTPDGKSTDAFTSPVYAVIDGTNTTVAITPKKSIPTVVKKILDDSMVQNVAITDQTGWQDYADSQIGQEVNYKLTGTIADNYASYDSYSYKFTDTLTKGLSYVKGQTKVYAVNKDSNNKDKYTDISDNFTVNSVNSTDGTTTLTVEANAGDHSKHLKEISSSTVNANTTIVVFYKAKLNSAAVVGNNNESVGGNPNTVKLEYSNNPFATGTGTSVEDTVADFTFKLNLNKVDQGTGKGLKGAVFTIQSNDQNTDGKYVASTADNGKGVIAGQLVSVGNANELPSYVKFTSNEKGEIAASGLDAGSYTVHEVSAPSGSNGNYTPAEDFTFTIEPKYNSEGTKVTQLKAVPTDASRKDIAIGKLDNVTGDNQLKVVDDPTINASSGAVTITVGNTKSVGLPLTGLNGVTFTWIAGGAVLCIGVAHLIRSRKQAEESEQE